MEFPVARFGFMLNVISDGIMWDLNYVCGEIDDRDDANY